MSKSRNGESSNESKKNFEALVSETPAQALLRKRIEYELKKATEQTIQVTYITACQIPDSNNNVGGEFYFPPSTAKTQSESGTTRESDEDVTQRIFQLIKLLAIHAGLEHFKNHFYEKDKKNFKSSVEFDQSFNDWFTQLEKANTEPTLTESADYFELLHLLKPFYHIKKESENHVTVLATHENMFWPAKSRGSLPWSSFLELLSNIEKLASLLPPNLILVLASFPVLLESSDRRKEVRNMVFTVQCGNNPRINTPSKFGISNQDLEYPGTTSSHYAYISESTPLQNELHKQCVLLCNRLKQGEVVQIEEVLALKDLCLSNIDYPPPDALIENLTYLSQILSLHKKMSALKRIPDNLINDLTNNIMNTMGEFIVSITNKSNQFMTQLNFDSIPVAILDKDSIGIGTTLGNLDCVTTVGKAQTLFTCEICAEHPTGGAVKIFKRKMSEAQITRDSLIPTHVIHVVAANSCNIWNKETLGTTLLKVDPKLECGLKSLDDFSSELKPHLSDSFSTSLTNSPFGGRINITQYSPVVIDQLPSHFRRQVDWHNRLVSTRFELIKIDTLLQFWQSGDTHQKCDLLAWAFNNNHPRIVEELLQHFFSDNPVELIKFAAKNQRFDVIDRIIHHLIYDVQQVIALLRLRSEEMTALVFKNFSEDPEEAKNFLGDVLLEVIMQNDLDLFKMLIDKPLDLTRVVTGQGLMAIHLMIQQSRWDMLRLLIKKDVNSNQKSMFGMTPLQYAINLKQFEAIKLLLEFPRLTIDKDIAYQIFDKAFTEKSSDVIKALLNKIDKPMLYEILINSIYHSRSDLVIELLHTVDDKSKGYLLFAAISHHQRGAVTLLMYLGLNPNQPFEMITPLTYAFLLKYWEVVSELLHWGGKIDFSLMDDKDEFKQYLLEAAQQGWVYEAVKILDMATEYLVQDTKTLDKLLILAQAKNNEELYNHLLEKRFPNQTKVKIIHPSSQLEENKISNKNNLNISVSPHGFFTRTTSPSSQDDSILKSPLSENKTTTLKQKYSQDDSSITPTSPTKTKRAG